MYYIELDGKTVTVFYSCLEYEEATKNIPDSDSRLFAVHPDKNKFMWVDPETGRYVYMRDFEHETKY
jgi:hypothetical protein